MDQIDWQVELRKIEREYDGLPPEPSRAEIRAQRMKELRDREEAEKRVALFGASARLALVGLLLGALWWWPYRSSCGLGVGAFVGAQSMVVGGGVLASGFSWRHRLGPSHTIALAFLVTGLALVAVQVLPRFGLVTVSGMHATGWRCTTALGL